MEIHEMKLRKEFLKHVTSKYCLKDGHDKLRLIATPLWNIPIEKCQDSIEFEHFEEDLTSLLTFLFIYQESNNTVIINNSDVEEAAGILSEVKKWIDEYLTSGNTNIFTLIYSVLAYFSFSIDEIFQLSLYSKEEIDRITTEYYKIIDVINFSQVLKDGAPYEEKEIVRIFVEGETNKDIDKIYTMVTSLEMGVGFNFPYMYQSIILSIFNNNYEYFIRLVNSANSFIKTYFIVKSIDYTSIFQKILIKDIHSELFLIELIRRACLDKSSKNDLQLNISEYLTKLASIDEDLFWQVIKYLKNSELLILSLSYAFIRMDNSFLSKYSEFFEFEEFPGPNNGKVYDQFLRNLYIPSKKHAVRQFCSIIYGKWELFTANMISYNKSLYDIYLSSYDKIIQWHILQTLSFKDIRKELNKQIRNLERIDSIWFIDISQQSTFYFISLTKLYLFAFGIKEKQYPFRQIISLRKKIRTILNDKRLYTKHKFSTELECRFKEIKRSLLVFNRNPL